MKFEFSNVRTDGELRAKGDALLRIVGDFALRVRGRVLYKEVDFCLVEFAVAMTKWLAIAPEFRPDFVYTSLESETEGLVRFTRLSPDSWRISAADQEQPSAESLATAELEVAAHTYISALREHLLPRVDILDCVESSRIGRDCLLVVLRPALTLGLGLRWPIEAFQVGSTTYRDTGLGEWTGFYDWIRRADGEIIGVRYWPATENQPLLEAVRALEYVVIGDSGCVEIYFRLATADPTRSNDQEFQYDAVFRSSTGGEWAIAFDTAALAKTDVDSLRRMDATWIVAIRL